jgi:2-polyprenyl-6-methoxyphenol hydroxylase-like FAD-dependent oxidoreductase
MMDVCVVGGGPAGLFTALLLVKGGLKVTVLEKHADFLRDFRGDTVHPSTLDLLDQLGLTDQVNALPHRDVNGLRFTFDDGTFTMADFSRLPGRHPYVMFMPQWDLLDLLATEAARYEGFTLLRSTEATDVLREGGRVVGVRATGPDGEVEIRAGLTIGADGRASVLRDRVGLTPKDFGAPMDVLWFRLPRADSDPEGLDMRVGGGGLLLLIDRGTYFQMADIIRKGAFEAVKARGLPAFRQRIEQLAPFLSGRTDAIGSFDDVKMLTVQLNRLDRWHAPGILFIGDAAHAMSPIGGVGINLAIQDAVAAARLLLPGLRAGRLSTKDLNAVRDRRYFPTAVTQFVQRMIQNQLLGRLLATKGPVKAPRGLGLLTRLPGVPVIPARLFGFGVRRESPPDYSAISDRNQS